MAINNNTAPIPVRHRTAFIATLLTGTFSMSISQSSLSTAYPTFMRSFHLGASTVAWLTTGFMLVMSLMIPVSPWLLSNVKFKALFQGVVSLFAVGTALCIWAPTFTILMVGRLLEALAVGIIFPSYQTVLLTITPTNQRGRVMGTAGLVMGSALAVGPIISGVLLTWFPWQALFALFLVVALVVLATSTATISDVMTLHLTRLDWLSVVLAASFPVLLYVLSAATNGHMTISLLLLLVLALLAAVWFVHRQLHRDQPLLQLHVLATPLFTQSVLLTGISYIGLIVTTIVMPLYFQTVLHVSPLVSGLALVPAAVGLSLLNPRTADARPDGPTQSGGDRDDPHRWWFCRYGVIGGPPTLWLAIIGAMVTEAGNAFVMMPSVTAGANALPPALIPDGTAVTTTVRQLLGSLGVAIATIVLQTVEQVSGSAITGFRATFACFAVVGVIGWLLGLRLPSKAARAGRYD